MIRVFSPRDSELEAPEEPIDGQAGGGEDRISRGFELIFGTQLREYLHRIESLEAQTADRLEAIENRLSLQSEALSEQSDKAAAALEREQGEYQRRKGIDAEFAEKLGRFRTSLDVALEEISHKLETYERELREQIDTLQTAQHSDGVDRDEKLLEALSEDLDRLETQKVSRPELATLLANVARELMPAKNDN